MSTQFYNEMAQVVTDLIQEFGVDMTVTRTDVDTAAVSSFTIRALFISQTPLAIAAVVLGAVDCRLVCDNKQAIMDTDRLDVNGGTWILTKVTPIQPADVILGYKAEMRIG